MTQEKINQKTIGEFVERATVQRAETFVKENYGELMREIRNGNSLRVAELFGYFVQLEAKRATQPKSFNGYCEYCKTTVTLDYFTRCRNCGKTCNAYPNQTDQNANVFDSKPEPSNFPGGKMVDAAKEFLRENSKMLQTKFDFKNIEFVTLALMFADFA